MAAFDILPSNPTGPAQILVHGILAVAFGVVRIISNLLIDAGIDIVLGHTLFILSVISWCLQCLLPSFEEISWP